SHQPIRRRERIMSGSSRRGRFNSSFPLMTRSPTFFPAAETTTPPQTSGPAVPRPSPPGPTSPASSWLHNHAYRRASLSPSRFPSICRSQVDGAAPTGAVKVSIVPNTSALGPRRDKFVTDSFDSALRWGENLGWVGSDLIRLEL